MNKLSVKYPGPRMKTAAYVLKFLEKVNGAGPELDEIATHMQMSIFQSNTAKTKEILIKLINWPSSTSPYTYT